MRVMHWIPLVFASMLALPLNAEAQQDFWQWLKPQFELSQLPHPDIDQWEARYRRRHLELEVILEEGKEFLYPLALAVADRGMPIELALLPIVESHLDPTAVSASGARGLWQLLPPTAENLGLKHDWWLDESADYLLSTSAALDYLEYLHERFGGWLLTLAAYNGGEGRVWRKLRENRSKGISTDLWHLGLPRQTEVYIPKLLGLARVLADPQGVKLPTLLTLRSFARVSLPYPLDVAQISELSGVSIEKIYRLNPQWLRWAMPPEGEHTAYLPIQASKRLREAVKNLAASERRRWHAHKVRPGETVSAIAKDHSADIKLLRRLNPFKDDLLRPGETVLLVAGSPTLERTTRRAVLERQRLRYAPRPLPAGVHKVSAGENLWTIARRYGISVQRLRQLNALGQRTALVPGQLMQTGHKRGGQHLTYTVRSGDALSLIADRFNVSVREIRRWNQLDSTTLRPGQKLRLQIEG